MLTTHKNETEKNTGLINTTNQQIIEQVFLNETNGTYEEKMKKARDLIRNKYALAREGQIIPEKLNKYSDFYDIANYVLLTYLRIHSENEEQFYTHGIEHAGRAAAEVDIFIELLRSFDHEFVAPLIKDPELVTVLKIAALFHDVGRIKNKNDLHDDSPEEHKEGAEMCKEFLIKLKFSPEKAQLAYNIIVNKDHPEKLNSETEKACGFILHDVDCSEVMRACDWNFDYQYLLFYEKIARNNWTAYKDLLTAIKGIKEVQNDMGDSPKPLRLQAENGEKDTQDAKKREEIDVHLPSGYSPNQKLATVNSLQPYTDIHSRFSANPTLSPFLENVFVQIPVYESAAAKNEAESNCFGILPETARATDVNLPQKQTVKVEDMPYYTDITSSDYGKEYLTCHTETLFTFKGNYRPPEEIFSEGGIMPFGILSDTVQKPTLQSVSLNVFSHQCNTTNTAKSSAILSCSNNSEVALSFATFKHELAQSLEGYVYGITINGAITNKHAFFRREEEYSILGIIPNTNIVIYRKVVNEGINRYTGAIFIKEKFLREMSREEAIKCCQLLLNRDLNTNEVFYFPIEANNTLIPEETIKLISKITNNPQQTEDIRKFLSKKIHFSLFKKFENNQEQIKNLIKNLATLASLINVDIKELSNGEKIFAVLVQAELTGTLSEKIQQIMDPKKNIGKDFLRILAPNANLKNTCFRSFDFSGCSIKANLTNADLTNANLIGTDFTGSQLNEAILDGAILDKTSFKTIRASGRTDFQRAILFGDFFDVDLSNVDLTEIKLKNVVFNKKTFDSLSEKQKRQINFSGVKFTGSFAGTNFCGANLNGAILDAEAFCSLQEKIINYKNLVLTGDFSKANFQCPTMLQGISLDKNVINSFTESQRTKICFSGARIVGDCAVNLKGLSVNKETVSFLDKTQLEQISFTGAMLEGDFSEITTLNRNNMKGAILDKQAFISLKNIINPEDIAISGDFTGIDFDGIKNIREIKFAPGVVLDKKAFTALYNLGKRDFKNVTFTGDFTDVCFSDNTEISGVVFKDAILNEKSFMAFCNASRKRSSSTSSSLFFSNSNTINFKNCALRGDFSNANFNNISLEDVNLSEADLSKNSFKGVVLTAKEFITLYNLNIRDFSGAVFKGSFANVNFTGVKLEGANFYEVLNKNEINIKKAKIDFNTLANLYESGAKLSECELTNKNFKRLDLSRIDFSVLADLKTIILIIDGAKLSDKQFQEVKNNAPEGIRDYLYLDSESKINLIECLITYLQSQTLDSNLAQSIIDKISSLPSFSCLFGGMRDSPNTDDIDDENKLDKIIDVLNNSEYSKQSSGNDSQVYEICEKFIGFMDKKSLLITGSTTTVPITGGVDYDVAALCYY